MSQKTKLYTSSTIKTQMNLVSSSFWADSAVSEQCALYRVFELKLPEIKCLLGHQKCTLKVRVRRPCTKLTFFLTLY